MIKTHINRWLSAIIIFTTLFGFIRPQNAYACSCMYNPDLTDEERLLENFNREYNEVVFTGTVVNTELYRPNPAEASSADPIYVTFDVDMVYKGDLASEFTVTTQADSASCGFNFAEGSRYLVFAGNGESNWNTGLCSGNVESPSAEMLVVLGNSNGPTANGIAGAELLVSDNTAVFGQTELLILIAIITVLIIGGIFFAKRLNKATIVLLLSIVLLGFTACAPNSAKGEENPTQQPAIDVPLPEETNEMTPDTLATYTWELVSAGDPASDMFLPDPPATLTFLSEINEAGRFGFNGASGCNNLFGSYTVTDGVLDMVVGQTKKACPTDLMNFENFMVQVLSSNPTVEVRTEGNDTFLTLQQPGNESGRLMFRGKVG